MKFAGDKSRTENKTAGKGVGDDEDFERTAEAVKSDSGKSRTSCGGAGDSRDTEEPADIVQPASKEAKFADEGAPDDCGSKETETEIQPALKKAKIVDGAAADGGEPDVSNKTKPSAAQGVFGTGIRAASAGQRETTGKSIAGIDLDK